MEDEEDLYGYGDTAVAELPQPGIYDERAPQLNSYQPYDPRAPQLNRPTGDVDWNYVNRAVAAQRSAQMVQMRRQQAEAKAEQDAVRFQGVQEYGELIKGGATPQEALRRTAGKINYQNPAAILPTTRLLQSLEPKPQFDPVIKDVGGVKVMDFGNRKQIIPGQSLKPPEPTKIPTALNTQLGDVLSQLRALSKMALEKPKDAAKLQPQIAILTAKKKEIERIAKEAGVEMVDDPEFRDEVVTEDKRNPVSKLLGFGGPTTTTNKVPFYPSRESPKKEITPTLEEETVKVINKSGQKGFIKKSKLDAALKAGFKLAD